MTGWRWQIGTLLVLLLAAAPSAAQEVPALAGPEHQAQADTLQHALENNRTGQSADWVNPDTDHAGSVTPVKTFDGPAGEPCREFLSTVTIAGEQQQAYGTACRQPDGSWQIVPDAAPAVPSPPVTVNVPPPAAYYAYPGLYGAYPIYLSFGFVFRTGHRHPGVYFLDGPAFRHRYPVRYHRVVPVRPRYFERYRRYPEPAPREYREQERDRHRYDYRDRDRDRYRYDYRDRHDFRDRDANRDRDRFEYHDRDREHDRDRDRDGGRGRR